MTPIIELRKGQTVRWLGRERLVAAVSHYDDDGLSLVRFEDGRWLHCAPDHKLPVVR